MRLSISSVFVGLINPSKRPVSLQIRGTIVKLKKIDFYGPDRIKSIPVHGPSIFV